MESSFSISACEYAAPTTTLGSRGAGVVTLLLEEALRWSCGLQNGEAELRSRSDAALHRQIQSHNLLGSIC